MDTINEDDIINPALAEQESDDLVLNDNALNQILHQTDISAPMMESIKESILYSLKLQKNNTVMPHQAEAELMDKYLYLNNKFNEKKELEISVNSLEAFSNHLGGTFNYSREILDFVKHTNSDTRTANPQGAQTHIQDAISDGIITTSSKIIDSIINVSRRVFTALSDYFQSFIKSMLSLSEESVVLLNKLRSLNTATVADPTEITIHDANFLLTYNTSGSSAVLKTFNILIDVQEKYIVNYIEKCGEYFDDYYALCKEIIKLHSVVENDPNVKSGEYELKDTKNNFYALMTKWLYPESVLNKTLTINSSGKVDGELSSKAVSKEELLEQANKKFSDVLNKGITDLENSVGIIENLPGGMSFGMLKKHSEEGLVAPKLFQPKGAEVASTQNINVLSVTELREFLNKVILITNVTKGADKYRLDLFNKLSEAHKKTVEGSDNNERVLNYLAQHLASKKLHTSISDLMAPIKDLDVYTFKTTLHLLNYCKTCAKIYNI